MRPRDCRVRPGTWRVRPISPQEERRIEAMRAVAMSLIMGRGWQVSLEGSISGQSEEGLGLVGLVSRVLASMASRSLLRVRADLVLRITNARLMDMQRLVKGQPMSKSVE